MLLDSKSAKSLIDTISIGDMDEAARFIEELPKINVFIDQEDPLRRITLLHLACETPKGEKLVKLLLDKGVSDFFVDQEQQSPLHYAQKHNQLASAELLVAKFPSLRVKTDMHGKSPLHYAAHENKLDFLKRYLELWVDNKRSPCNLNVPDNNDLTPLHYAAMGGHLDAVKMLVAHGANVHARCDVNETPADYAECYAAIEPEKYNSIVHYLREKMFPTLFFLCAKEIRKEVPDEDWEEFFSCITQRADKLIFSNQVNQMIAKRKQAYLDMKWEEASKDFAKLKIT